MFPVRYELGFCIPGDGVLHSHSRENLKYYIALTGWARRNVFSVRYELGFISQKSAFLRVAPVKTTNLT
jgi:hypothetical protein